MRRLTRRTWFGVVLLCALWAPTASGQTAAETLDELQIDLWPEYDRPDVLVMYKFRRGAAGNPDALVPLPIPASVGEPHAVAWRDAKGALFVAEFTRVVEGSRAMVSMRLGSPEGQLEFYAPLEREGDRRAYRFQWPGGISVKALSIRIQRPLGARDLNVQPEPSREWQGEDGLAYALVELGPQEPESTPTVEVSYVKDSPTLSAGEAAPPPAATASPPAPSNDVSIPNWAVALGGLFVALAGGALLWSSRRPSSRLAERENESEPRKASRGTAIFCHHCGAKAELDHSFCMACGTKLVKPK